MSPLKRLVALTYRIPIEYVERAGLALSEIDLVEVNEAFACQNLAVEKELGLDRKKVNVNGGAIAIGHPLGATRTRLTTTLVYDLKKDATRATRLAAPASAAARAIALVLERI